MTTKISSYVIQAALLNQIANIVPRVTSIGYIGDDTATDTAGGQTVTVQGSGFQNGAVVYIDTTAASAVTVSNSSFLSFTAPAKTAGSYILYVTNPDGGSAIYAPGVQYSGVPIWTTPAGSQGAVYETIGYTNVFAASGDPITYSLISGSFPPGASFNTTTGILSGTAPADTGSTTYSFTIRANDTQNQSTDRSFSLTINTDVVTWSAPSDGATYSVPQNSAITPVTLSATAASGSAVTYTANSLPTGISLASGSISGTPTVAGNNVTLLTATSSTSTRTATRTINWSVYVAGDTFWNLTTLALNALPVTIPFNSDASLNNASISVVADTRASPYNPYQTGYYSNYFDGTGDYLSTTVTNQAPGTGNFTYECWFYVTSLAANRSIMNTRSADTTDGFDLSVTTAGAIGATYSFTGLFTSTSGVVVINTWYHIAVVRTAGTTITVYLNGTSLGNFTAGGSQNYTSTTLYVGAAALAGTPMLGYISNFRYTRSPVYTAAFTPGTTPLSPIANTALLTAQSNRLIDASPNNFTITKNGDTTAVPANPFATVYDYGTTYYSTYFDGSGDYLTVSGTANAAFGFGTGDFTIEGWFYGTADNATDFMIDFRGSAVPSAPAIFVYTSNQLALYYNSSVVYQPASLTFTFNTWNHVALVRASNVTKFYLNGTGAATTYTDNNNYPSAACIIGTDSVAGGSSYWTGQISNLRIVKGTAVYTGNFTPPTSPLTAITGTSLLTCQNATLVDNSTNAFAITSSGQAQPRPVSPFSTTNYTTASTTLPTLGSAYFDGTGDYLTVAASSAFYISSGNWTIETWVYKQTTGKQIIVSQTQNTGAPYAGWSIYVGTTEKFTFEGTNGGTIGSPTVTVPLNAWTHLAASKSGSTIYLYQNGVLVNSGAMPSVTDYSVQLAIGNYSSYVSGADWNGYISNLRMVKGTALYTANFQPSPTPLTAVTNTQLLTLQYNGGSNDSQFRDDSNFQNLITRNGNATQGTFSPFSATGWSAYFDGSGDYLSINYSTGSTISGDFTWETWAYDTGTTYGTLLGWRTGSTGWSGFVIQRNNSSNITLSINNSAATITQTSATYLSNQWNHVAVVRSGTTVTLYVNGTSAGTATLSGSFNPGSSYWIGSDPYNNVSSVQMKGYVSNQRFVNGTAIYTSAFTPPTSPLTAVANTGLLTCQSASFVDNSPNRFTITPNGDANVQSFSPFNGVTTTPCYSGYFDGTGDYLTVADNVALQFSTGNFTIECWVYEPDQSGVHNTVIGKWGTGFGTTGDWSLRTRFNSVTQLAFTLKNSSGWYDITTSFSVSNNAWHHIAVVRDSSTTIKLYADGVLKATQAILSGDIVGPSATLSIGGNSASATNEGASTGYISNVRITKGQALYTANFTPATSPLTTTSQSATAVNVSLLTCQSSTFIDNSVNAFAITAAGDAKPTTIAPFAATSTTGIGYTTLVNGGSAYFDGTGDYLTIPANSPSTIMGYSDFTVEAWIYPTTYAGTAQVIASGQNDLASAAGSSWCLYIASATNSDSYSGGTTIGPASPNPVKNQWSHVAYVRSGTSLKTYLNGVQAGSASFASSTTAVNNGATTYAPSIGAFANGLSPFGGYISNFRITKSALYTAAFVPPNIPATNSVTTTLSVAGTNSSIIDYTGKNDLETVADARLAPQNPYGGSYYSNYFDGTSDWLTTTLTGQTLGSGDFTIEFWMFQQINETHIFTYGTNWGDTTGVQMIYYSGSTNYALFVGGVTNNFFGPILRDQWVHVAVVRSSGTVKVYFNGVASATTLSTTTNLTATALNIGYANTGNWASYAGYISNFRMVSGTAIYTTNFVPPTSPLTAVAGTRILTCQSSTLKDNSSNAFTITRNGDTAVNSINPFQNNGTYSMYFDGTGDYLVAPNSPGFAFGTGDFTVECWVYCTTFGANGFLVLDSRPSGSAAPYTMGVTVTGLPYVYDGGTITSGSSGITLNSWAHLTWCRASSTLRMFVNGVSVYSASYTASLTGTGSLTIGGLVAGGAGYFLNGYMTDLRITKYARYTAAFTPPTSTFYTK